MVSTELPPGLIDAGLKDLLSLGQTGRDGFKVTFRVAEAGAALLPLLVCKAPAGSLFTYSRLRSRSLQSSFLFDMVTRTVTVQEPLAGIEPPVSVTVEPPFGAVTVPPQVVLGIPETTKPFGNVSMNGEVKLAAVAFGLFRIMVRVELPSSTTEVGLKDLLNVGGTGGTGVTTKVAIAGPLLLPLLVCKAPAASELK
jgi:hypothetical protein